ncbi:AEC family transporter [Bacillus sp. FJAT-29814]|uniref:AEC family transporter n=1 Tax=Bacillus sp. FJAT-29814 TaxID=1729688 RepID=UPI00082D4C41|nr:AEC family transporter [Bacillus sp. FJAT-29814]
MDLLLVILPAFLIFTAGYIGQKVLKLNVKSISTMALYLMTPFLTFETFYKNQLNIDYFYMFIFSVLLTGILIIISIIAGVIAKMDKVHVSALMLGGIFPNSGNYGAPVALFAFGHEAFNYAVIIMVIHGLLINTVGIFIASYGNKNASSIKTALMNVVKMPIIYGVILGLLFQFLNIRLPSTILDSISLVGDATIPTIMLVLGMQLSEMKVQNFGKRYVNIITFVKMILSPAIAAVLVLFMPVDQTIKQVFILLGAMPVAANTIILALQFEIEPDLISYTTLITTLLSLITVPFTLFLIS